ncbi:ABC transporter permease [Actinomadura scrupuli]|uniref:ABC transporter permease n=1 Tax=Actinomadura scrupuli TaxID=559629 RepID=UPI003D97FE2E
MMAKVTLRNLAAHKLRLALTALSVILGVAFVAGTLIFTDTMTKSFDDIFDRVGKGVAVQVKGKEIVSGDDDDESQRAPVPQALVGTLAKVPGVRSATGHVQGYAALIGKDGKVVGGGGPPQFGANWTDGGDDKIATGRAPQGPAEVAVDAETAKKAGYRVGDQAKVLSREKPLPVTIVGIVDTGHLNGATFTVFDTATAQRLLYKPGYFSDVTLAPQGGADEQKVLAEVKRVLPAGYDAITGTQMRKDAKSDLDQIMSIFRTFLLVFALISIFVGAFIIFNTFSMLVAQRTRELALLRAVGASRRQVTRAVMGEAFGVGVVGSTLGLALGAGIATVLQAFFKGQGLDLKGGLVFTATPVIWAYTVGIIVTMVSAYFPARRAAKIPPVAAMRDDVALPQRSLRIRIVIGAVMTAAGAALLGMGVGGVGSQPLLLLGVGALLVFLGVAMLAPVISKPVVRVLGAAYPRLFGLPGRLAQQNAMRDPRRTASTAAALMIGLSLVTTVNVMGSSLSASIGQTVDQQFGVDYFVGAENGGGFSPAAATDVATASGVSKATPIYSGRLSVDGKSGSYTTGATADLIDGANVKMLSGGTDLGADGMLINEDVAKDKGWKPGTVVQAKFPNGTEQRLTVKGVYAKSDFLAPRVLSLAAFQAHTSGQLADGILVDAAKPSPATKTAILQSLKDYPNLTVQDQSDVKKDAQKEIDGLTVFLSVMLTLSIFIAAVGVVNTLALSVIERTREIGLLRAVGISRRQLRRMIRLESIVIAVFGALLGIGLGIAFGTAIQRGAADDGLQVLNIPFGTLVVYVIVAGIIGVLAALWPAWRAGRMDVLKAIGAE